MQTLFNAGIAACMVTLLLYPIIANAKTVGDSPCTATVGKTERRSRTTARADVSTLSYSKIGSYGQSVKARNKQLSVRGAYRNGVKVDSISVLDYVKKDKAGASAWITGNSDSQSWYASVRE